MTPVVFHRNFCLACQKGGVPWDVHEDYHRLLDAESTHQRAVPPEDFVELKEDLDDFKSAVEGGVDGLLSITWDLNQLAKQRPDDADEFLDLADRVKVIATDLKDYLT